MDEKVMNDDFVQRLASPLSLSHAGLLLSTIVDFTGEPLDENYARQQKATELVQTERLLPLLNQALEEQSFARIRTLACLQSPSVTYPLHLAIPRDLIITTATIGAWKNTYQGGAIEAFLTTINQYYLKAGQKYAHHIAIVQSSGTGKSRMLLEVSCVVFGVILNFRSDDLTGPDRAVRDYLIKPANAKLIVKRTNCFFITLFNHLSGHGSIREPADLAALLAYGDPENQHAREELFNAVIHDADELEVLPSTPQKEGSPKVLVQGRAGNTLRWLRSCTTVLADSSIDRPVKLILGFDEASEMAAIVPTRNWSPYTIIRQALRSICDSHIFSAFSSTTGCVRWFHPTPEVEYSTRIQSGQLTLWPPFTLPGYDQLATALHEGVKLSDVTDEKFMLSLGRPLYDSGSPGVKRNIIKFTKEALLNGKDPNSKQLAPLAVRLPLTFNSLTSNGCQAEQLQVKSHMCICLNIIPEADTMCTVAPSEPALVEAAAQLMNHPNMSAGQNPVEVVAGFLSDCFLLKGDRGELACMVLMLLAHDQACDLCDLGGKSSMERLFMHYHKPLQVTEFLPTLLATKHSLTILKAQPPAGGMPFEKRFSTLYVHFMHCVKVMDYKVMDCKFLMQMMAWGAAILCADSQVGVDIIIPACYDGETLTLENITPLLYQIKSLAALFHLDPTLFANLEPTSLGVYGKTNEPLPVIKIVLSVGVPNALFECLTVRELKRPSSLTPIIGMLFSRLWIHRRLNVAPFSHYATSA
ncbi:hypothetical protein JB92DRAFT_3116600 [Gautieria morchelliformis]|nr:hypothetical protein JB92DRAFT_3116600 [Gautieria morchelliformis]